MNRTAAALAALLAALALTACGGGSEDPAEPAIVVSAPAPSPGPVDCNVNPKACQ